MDRREDNFKSNNFSWFTGEVTKIAEDGSNRVKVYPHGYYSVEYKDVGKADVLPWATVMMPSTSGGTIDSGQNHSLEVGSHVVGFFRDGPSAQDPIVMGVIHGQDIPTGASPTNKVHTSKSGHLVEFDNTEGSERINIKHKSGTTINIASDGTVNISSSNNTVNIVGNTTVTGTIHATGDISTDAGNAPSLAEHKHIEVPGTGGSASPTPAQQNTSKPDEKIAE